MALDKKKILYVAGGAVALYGLALLVFWVALEVRKRKAFGEGDEDHSPDGTSSSNNASSSGLPNFPLKWGSGTSRNAYPANVRTLVKDIQILCNNWTNAGLLKDGIWGNNTELAVQRLKTITRVKRKNQDSNTNFGVIETPFARCIDTVVVPLSSESKVQVSTVSAFNEMKRWNKEHVNKYVKV